MPLDNLKNCRVMNVSESNMPQVRSIFYHAYQDNNLLRFMLNAKRNGFEQRLRGFIRAQLSTHYRGNNQSLAIADGDRLVGVAMINRSGKPYQLTASWRWRMSMYSVAGIYYTEELRRYYQEIDNATGDVDFYWITLIALHPDYQHHGYGHMLMKAAHRECEKNSDFNALCVDTSNAEQRHFFESLGYKEIAGIPVSDINMNLMFQHRKSITDSFSESKEALSH